jgi:mannose-6-phosphate isomerase-like protein (cupin superfamily)
MGAQNRTKFFALRGRKPLFDFRKVTLGHFRVAWAAVRGSLENMSESEPRYAIAQLDEIAPTPCPCGQARRAFKEPWNNLATVHLTDISVDAKRHYHKKMTEIYIVLEGEGHIELDGELIPVKPMTSVMIRPGCVHRAVGNLRIINVPMPPFDPTDEFEVD